MFDVSIPGMMLSAESATYQPDDVAVIAGLGRLRHEHLLRSAVSTPAPEIGAILLNVSVAATLDSKRIDEC